MRPTHRSSVFLLYHRAQDLGIDFVETTSHGVSLAFSFDWVYNANDCPRRYIAAESCGPALTLLCKCFLLVILCQTVGQAEQNPGPATRLMWPASPMATRP